MKLLNLSVASLVLSSTLFASTEIDKKVVAFEKQRLSQNQGITLKNVKITTKEALSIKGWYGYVLSVQADVPGRGPISVNDMVFSNGDAFTMELINMKTGRSFKDMLMPKVTNTYYKKDHLIAGNENAKNKVVVFSDPLCPACQQSLPSIIGKAKTNPKDIALYYYHFPLLSLHPASDVLSKAMIVAKQKGIKNIENRIYTTDFSEYFAASETDAELILDGFNEVFKTNITLSEINKAAIKHESSSDFKMGEDVMVQGTPTLFVNGINDRTRTLFESLTQ